MNDCIDLLSACEIANLLGSCSDIQSGIVGSPVVFRNGSFTNAVIDTVDCISMLKEEIDEIPGNSGKCKDLIIH